MPPFRERRSPRLVGYDYSRDGFYFVTICTYDREPVLGDIVSGELRATASGQAARDAWQALPDRFPIFDLDAFVVMPNHVHGIVILGDDLAGSGAPTTLPRVLRAFKSMSGIEGNRALGRADRPFWQRSYHDRVIRNDSELAAIRRYIADNPPRWESDADHPDRWRRL